MADQAPTAAKIVANAPVANFTPIAVHFPVKLRPSMVQAVKDFVPPGKPNPVTVATVKELVLELIDALPDDVNGVEVKIEVSGFTAVQIMVLVIPHKL